MKKKSRLLIAGLGNFPVTIFQSNPAKPSRPITRLTRNSQSPLSMPAMVSLGTPLSQGDNLEITRIAGPPMDQHALPCAPEDNTPIALSPPVPQPPLPWLPDHLRQSHKGAARAAGQPREQPPARCSAQSQSATVLDPSPSSVRRFGAPP